MIRGGFFNSINEDRKYLAKHFAEYFATFIGNGVFPNPATGLEVFANDNMTVTVKAGKAWINGYYLINDTDHILKIENSDGLLSRVDRVVIRCDFGERTMKIVNKKGDFSSSPKAKTLQRDNDIYELSLADIRVDKAAVRITQSSILDTRLSNELCGIVHTTVEQIDTDVLFKDYVKWLEEQKSKFENDTKDFEKFLEEYKVDFTKELNDWLDSIKDIMDENIAINLMNKINELEVRTNNKLSELELFTYIFM